MAMAAGATGDRHGDAGDALGSTASERILRAASARLPEVGDRFGQFTLARFLGRGTFGSVFEAQQDEPVRRTVAVKVLTGAERSAQAERRFDVERQALAALSHAGIAAIVDGGVSSDGTPWFAMELVDGQPVDAFAAARGLDARARMALVCQACDAVDYAHRRGILHRDLKPGNVLVRLDGGVASVKVIDFGLAKLTGVRSTAEGGTDARPAGSADGSVSGHPDATIAGHALGTPAFMSPEAASGDPARIDARSDVYSLAAIALRLLTGASANLVGPDDPFDRLRSSRISRRGDLEAVLRRGLAMDPDARYQRCSDLAEDLERWSGGFPVLARPRPPIRRALRFAGRHPVALAIAGALSVGLAMTTAWALLQASDAQRRQADAEARAERMRIAVEPLLNSLQITRMADESLKVRQLLVQVFEEVLGPSHPKTNSRRLFYAQTLRGARDFGGALAQFSRLLEVVRSQGLDETSPAAQLIIGQIADTLRMKGDATAARELCEWCVLLADRVRDGCDGNFQQARLALVCLLIEDGEGGRAVDEAFCAVDALARCQPDAHGQRVIADSLLADALMEAGRVEEGRAVGRLLRARVPELASIGPSLEGVMREWRAQEVLEDAERLAATDPGGAALMREAEAAAVETELRRSPPVVARLRAWQWSEAAN